MSLENAYRESLYHCKILTREEEIAAFDRGDLNAIVESVLPLIFREAARICRTRPEFLLDVVSDGNLSLTYAIKSYDAHKARFTTWCVNYAKLKMFDRFRKLCKRRLTCNSDELILQAADHHREVDMAAIQEMYSHVASILPNVRKRDCECLLRWVDGETLQSIGDSYGLSRERIRQLVQAAISDIRANLAARGIA